MDTADWCGFLVRTRAGLRFGVVVGVFTEGPHAGRLRVHGTYRFGGGTRAQWHGTLVYAIPPEVVRRTRRGSLRLPVEAMAARAAWLVGELSQRDGSPSAAARYARPCRPDAGNLDSVPRAHPDELLSWCAYHLTG